MALDDNACTFVIRDPRNTNYELINNRSLSITQVSEQDAHTTDGSPRAEHSAEAAR